jgi:hypothetical protein
MKTGLQIILTIAIFYLGYLCYDSIKRPIDFQNEYNQRKAKVIERLEEIRNVEVAYKSVYKKYTGSFDTLLMFLKQDSLPLIKKIGRLTDSMLEAGMTESKALALGIIKRDTIRVAAKDSLFKENYAIDSLPFVPFSGGDKFILGAGTVTTGSGVKVQVFECKIPNEVYLKGLDKQEIININDKATKLERYPGLKVGSLEEANNNAGNWE